MPALRVGLTGGIGSGKSTVAGMLADCGAAIIDSDAISRQTTAPGGAAIPLISGHFGAEMVTAEGALDRARMRSLVFSDPQAKLRLEAIIHPLVGTETARQAVQAEESGKRCIVFDVPLLVESGRWRQNVHQVLVVDCSEEMQISRVIARNGWCREQVGQVMAGQASRSQRLAAADVCIANDGSVSLAALALLVRQAAQRFGL
ncbi:MAG: dephospho-CoA kinase [Pseudomonadota bacterium]|uniref:dephospho-CoA kinase n=1 Tax=Polaromonas sp. TaxID=1869339 RepID=UPI0018199724|nr:dephospho-CoA kinase [Polaromonas sp.]MBA3593167.1 dephospho-CoA kinase [Polaromonas sp.]MDQ3271114.1 dephospho-CoA kinase [Pseudomonadota bacterium]